MSRGMIGASITTHTTPALRRRAISDMLAQNGSNRLTLDEISQRLAQQGLTNPNGDPYSRATISHDVRAIETAWRQDSIRELGTHKAEQLARLEMLWRAAISQKDRDAALDVLKERAKLLGLNQPDTMVLVAIQQVIMTAVVELRTEFSDDPAALQRIERALARADQHLDAGLENS